MRQKNILIVAEIRGGKMLSSTRELVSAAARIGGRNGHPDTRILTAGACSPETAREICRETGLDVISPAWPCEVTPESLTLGLVSLMKDLDPGYLLFTHSTLGREVAPGVAARLGAASISGVTGILSDPGGTGFQRPVMDNTLIQTVRPPDKGCCILTLVPGAFAGDAAPEARGQACSGAVLEKEIAIDKSALKTTRIEILGPSGGDRGAAGLTSAKIVVAAGRGIGSRENLDRVFRFARAFPNAAVGASRPLVDQGWIPYPHQVGITGATVTPELYIACGISGSSQHLAGMSGSKWVVSVNTGADAPVCRSSDLCIQADVVEFIEAFLKLK
ncbi:MAG: electron transfer flavoprotein subunit alpha/FixB family protein [Desulfobacterales bacterium]|nr:electron transfer flavoprotein subunit alpha/FixB family protein [Desulfobacterales bacterium]